VILVSFHYLGNVIYANLIIKPNVTEGLSAEAGYNSTYNDTRYLRNWMVGPATDFPFGKEVMMQLQVCMEHSTNLNCLIVHINGRR
jgi:hypothetical protein